MKSMRNIVVVAGATVLLAGCMHRGTMATSAGDISDGEVTIDSLTASRTALLRIDNNNAEEVRVYTIIGHQKNYVAKAVPGQVRTWVLDPNLFPASSISFEAESKDGSMKQTLGPYKLDAGYVVDVVVPADFDRTRASIHRSTQ